MLCRHSRLTQNSSPHRSRDSPYPLLSSADLSLDIVFYISDKRDAFVGPDYRVYLSLSLSLSLATDNNITDNTFTDSVGVSQRGIVQLEVDTVFLWDYCLHS